MGTDMRAFVDYDTSPVDYPRFHPDRAIPPPFTDCGSIRSLSSGDDGLNTGSKNYPFFAAIAGVRGDPAMPPLFPPRGLPDEVSYSARMSIKNGYLGDEFDSGWLYLDEIRQALAKHSVPDSHIGTEIYIILDAMASIEARLGHRRARLLFSFWG